MTTLDLQGRIGSRAADGIIATLAQIQGALLLGITDNQDGTYTVRMRDDNGVVATLLIAGGGGGGGGTVDTAARNAANMAQAEIDAHEVSQHNTDATARASIAAEAITRAEGDTANSGALTAHEAMPHGGPTVLEYLGSYNALSAQARAEVNLGQYVLLNNRYWIVHLRDEARANIPGSGVNDGWRPIDGQYRGAAHVAARFYDAGDHTLVNGVLYFCEQEGEYTAAEIPTSANWSGSAPFDDAAIQTALNMAFVGQVFNPTTRVLTMTRRDGGTRTVTIPAVAGGMADGVISSADYEPGNDRVALGTSNGDTIYIDMDPIFDDLAAQWARTGNTDRIPQEKMSSEVQAHLDAHPTGGAWRGEWSATATYSDGEIFTYHDVPWLVHGGQTDALIPEPIQYQERRDDIQIIGTHWAGLKTSINSDQVSTITSYFSIGQRWIFADERAFLCVETGNYLHSDIPSSAGWKEIGAGRTLEQLQDAVAAMLTTPTDNDNVTAVYNDGDGTITLNSPASGDRRVYLPIYFASTQTYGFRNWSASSGVQGYLNAARNGETLNVINAFQVPAGNVTSLLGEFKQFAERAGVGGDSDPLTSPKPADVDDADVNKLYRTSNDIEAVLENPGNTVVMHFFESGNRRYYNPRGGIVAWPRGGDTTPDIALAYINGVSLVGTGVNQYLAEIDFDGDQPALVDPKVGFGVVGGAVILYDLTVDPNDPNFYTTGAFDAPDGANVLFQFENDGDLLDLHVGKHYVHLIHREQLEEELAGFSTELHGLITEYDDEASLPAVADRRAGHFYAYPSA